MSPPPQQSGPVKQKAKSSVGVRSFRGRLVTGILLIIPLAVTGILILYIYDLALSFGATAMELISRATAWVTGVAATGVTAQVDLKTLTQKISEDPVLAREVIRDYLTRVNVVHKPTIMEQAIAVSLTILLLYMVGWLGSNVVGKRIIEAFEALLERIPLVDTIYGSMKRMVHALSGVGKEETAQRVVLVDFPHADMKTIAFMTNTLTDSNTGRRFATVYVPTTPNPTGGYMEIVPLDKITHTDWSMEEALSIVLSGGATAPASFRIGPLPQSVEGDAGKSPSTPGPTPPSHPS